MRFVLICFLVIFCVGSTPAKEWEYLSESKDDECEIYLVNHGWHTGLIIPGKHLEPKLKFLESDFSRPEYYEIGWGDKGFYQADKITVKVVLKAVFWPTDSVMHIVGVPQKPQQYFPGSEIIEIPMSLEGMGHLIEFIAKSFGRDKNSKVIKSGSGLYGQSFFYEGRSRYFMTHTCNSWVGRALENAGVPIRGALALTAGSVTRQSRAAVDRYVCCDQ